MRNSGGHGGRGDRHMAFPLACLRYAMLLFFMCSLALKADVVLVGGCGSLKKSPMGHLRVHGFLYKGYEVIRFAMGSKFRA